jgi:hypothetical protein
MSDHQQGVVAVAVRLDCHGVALLEVERGAQGEEQGHIVGRHSLTQVVRVEGDALVRAEDARFL